MKPRITMILLAGLGFAWLGACATTLPAEEIAAPKAKIAAAEEAGAAEDPNAALHLMLAQEQFDKAGKLIENGEAESASRYLERASADAELALEMAHLDLTRDQAQRAMDSIRTLREDHDLISR